MSIRALILLTVLAAASLTARAQPALPDSLMTLITAPTYAGCTRLRVELNKRARLLYIKKDTATIKSIAARLNEEAARRGLPALRLYADELYAGYIYDFRYPHQLGPQLRGFQGLVKNARRLDDPPYLAWAESRQAAMLFDLKFYDAAFETALRVEQAVRGIPEREMPDRGDILCTIANFYYYFGEYRQAITILTDAVRAAPSPLRPLSVGRRCYTTLGLCYRGLGHYDSSDRCFREALAQATIERDSDWVRISGGNLGINLYRQGRYAEAVPLLVEDVRSSAVRGDLDNAAGSLLPLADIAVREGRVSKAAAMLDTARDYIGRRKSTARLPLYYALRIRGAAARGDEQLAATYADSLTAIKDSLAQQYSALHLARAQQRMQTAAIRADLSAATAHERLATVQRNALVVILLLASGVTVFGYLYFRRRRLALQEKAGAEAERAAAALRAKEKELEGAGAALKRFRQDVQEKAALIEQLSTQLDEEEHGAVLQQLRDATILTDEQWAEFRRLFEQVHSGFIGRLGQSYPGLSPAEVRFMVLARLGFSNKEMAGALGISPSSVRVIWHRLRRKLGLEEGAEVGALVEGI